MDGKGYWRTGFSPNVTIIKAARHVKALLSRATHLLHLILFTILHLIKKYRRDVGSLLSFGSLFSFESIKLRLFDVLKLIICMG